MLNSNKNLLTLTKHLKKRPHFSVFSPLLIKKQAIKHVF
nr:MAG TPA: hypothetical protein [Caudoviricetes sp.]